MEQPIFSSNEGMAALIKQCDERRYNDIVRIINMAASIARQECFGNNMDIDAYQHMDPELFRCKYSILPGAINDVNKAIRLQKQGVDLSLYDTDYSYGGYSFKENMNLIQAKYRQFIKLYKELQK